MAASEFADRAYHELERLQASPGYHRRTGPTKALVEEVVPLATFVKHFEAPQRRVRCKYLGRRTDKADAEIRLSGAAVSHGFYPSRLLIEITVAVQPYAYLQRELMETGQPVFGGPNIYRTASRHAKRSRIVNKPVVRDAGNEAEENAELIVQAVARKAARVGRRKRVLLVDLEPGNIMRPRDWRRLPELCFVPETCGRFLAVFIVETTSGTVCHIS